MERIYNFSSGPAVLPLSVLEEASRGVLEINGSGMSVLEVSHRGKDYEAIHYGAGERLLRIMGLSQEEYIVLFLGGGASLQFAMLPMNFLTPDKTACYVNAGEWGKKAIKEAKLFGQVHVAGSSEDKNFSYIPKQLDVNPGSAYFHYTTNNTIEGTTQFATPEVGDIPLITDASSEFLSRAMDFSRFSMIYAGAQKNLGPAGVTMIVMRKSFLETAREDIPAILSYKTHAKADSLYNTPPVFPIYVTGLTLKWIEEGGGLAVIEKRNREKAALIYDALDAYPDFYEPTVIQKEDRSLMNITFRIRDTEREKSFLSGAQERKMDGLKGHRSVGGFRASIYNAFPVEGCVALAEYLHEFAERGVRD